MKRFTATLDDGEPFEGKQTILLAPTKWSRLDWQAEGDFGCDG